MAAVLEEPFSILLNGSCPFLRRYQAMRSLGAICSHWCSDDLLKKRCQEFRKIHRQNSSRSKLSLGWIAPYKRRCLKIICLDHSMAGCIYDHSEQDLWWIVHVALMNRVAESSVFFYVLSYSLSMLNNTKRYWIAVLQHCFKRSGAHAS